MPEYRVTLARPALKELESLSAAHVQRVYARITSLASDPRPRGCLKLKGPENLWRIRCGVYRVVYAIDDEGHTVDVIQVRHRKDAYD